MLFFYCRKYLNRLRKLVGSKYVEPNAEVRWIWDLIWLIFAQNYGSRSNWINLFKNENQNEANKITGLIFEKLHINLQLINFFWVFFYMYTKMTDISTSLTFYCFYSSCNFRDYLIIIIPYSNLSQYNNF